MASDAFNATIGPIDTAEIIAEKKSWNFDRVAEDQIALAIEGQWRTYSLTLANSSFPQTLRLVCTYDFDPPKEQLQNLYETLNIINDRLWGANMTYWDNQNLMVVRSANIVPEDAHMSEDNIELLINQAVNTAETFYPAIQLTVWGDKTPQQAMKFAFQPTALRPQ